MNRYGCLCCATYGTFDQWNYNVNGRREQIKKKSKSFTQKTDVTFNKSYNQHMTNKCMAGTERWWREWWMVNGERWMAEQNKWFNYNFYCCELNWFKVNNSNHRTKTNLNKKEFEGPNQSPSNALHDFE